MCVSQQVYVREQELDGVHTCVFGAPLCERLGWAVSLLSLTSLSSLSSSL